MRWLTSPEDRGERLDRYLASRYDVARNQVSRWIQEGRVQVGGSRAKASTRLEGGEWVECEPLERDTADEMIAEEGPLEVLFEDPEVVVVDKPPEMVVHPGAGRETGTLAHRLLFHYPEIGGVGGPGRPGIVHRLDRGTSGAMVVARTPRAYAELSAAFAERRIDKRYLAVVYGAPRPAAGTIDAAIGRHPRRRKEMAVQPRGRASVTHYETLACESGLSVLSVGLETGRTHQIRVHLKHCGHPLVGDPVYGEARWKALPKRLRPRLEGFPRPALHAWRLGFPHPTSGESIEVVAPLPEDLRELWEGTTASAFPRASPSAT